MNRYWTNDTVQTVLALVSLAATAGAWLYDRYVVRRRRLSYRVHWNRPINPEPRVAQGMGLSITRGGAEVTEASVVVLRVENVGSLDIGPEDVQEPLVCSFGGRRIVHYEVQETDPPDLADDIVHPTSGAGPELVEYHPGAPDAAAAGSLRLPVFGMGRKHRFKLLVLLSGPQQRVTLRGRLAGGEIVPEGRRGPRSRRGLALGGTSLLLGGLVVGLIATGNAFGSGPEPLTCPPDGSLSVTGSTALAPVLGRLAGQYRARCPGARVEVTGNGTNAALDQLVQAGLADQQSHSQQAARVKLVMADEYLGKPARDPRLRYWPIGIAVFTVVVNRDVGVAGLSADQLRRLYAGRVPRWDDGGLEGSGTDVVLVSRTSDSGTRDVFAHQVLGGAETAPVSSSDCISRDIPGRQSEVTHCEVTTTQDVLRKVASTPGAVGYVSKAEADRSDDPDVHQVQLDGHSADAGTVADGSYPFWAVERLYRWGPELPAVLRDQFVQYVRAQPEASRVVQDYGFYLCTDQRFSLGPTAQACSPDASTTPVASGQV